MSAMPLEPGSIFAKDFKVVRPMAEGGMGTVYLVEQISTDKPRALKVMNPALWHDAALRARFAQEARIGAKIESDHVVEVVGAGVDEATRIPWMAMELLKGRDLSTALSERGGFPLDEAKAIFRQAGHALASAHRQGIVHRDLKPENIFLAESRREGGAVTVKILDFGIAKVLQENRAYGKTLGGLGTPLWLAPEQTHNGEITPATDVWALGLIAFALLTGRSYWKCADQDVPIVAVLTEMFAEALVPASQRAVEFGLRCELPDGFDEWFAHCVARDAHERFKSADACVNAFLSLRARGEAPTSSVVPHAPTLLATPPATPVVTPTVTPMITPTVMSSPLAPPPARGPARRTGTVVALVFVALVPAVVWGAYRVSSTRAPDPVSAASRGPEGHPEERPNTTPPMTAVSPLAPSPTPAAPVAVVQDAGAPRVTPPVAARRVPAPVVRRPLPPPVVATAPPEPPPPPPPPPPPTCADTQHLSDGHCCNAGEEWVPSQATCVCIDRRVCGRVAWRWGGRRRYNPGAADPWQPSEAPPPVAPQPPTQSPYPNAPPAPHACGTCHQGAVEQCNGCDDNCNGIVDEGCS